MKQTRFNFPINFFGFCSGWNKGFEPDGRYTITRRMPVRLETAPASFTQLFESSGELPPLLLKTRNGSATHTGLSSGAGSSLFEFEGEVFKIKRNGFLDDKYSFRPFLDSGIESGLDSIVESSITLNFRGVLTPERAEREVKAIRVLRSEGLCDAYDPIGFFTYDLPYRLSRTEKPLAGAALIRVISDIRVDEFVFALMSDYLRASIQNGTISYDPKGHAFLAHGSSVSDFFKEFNKDYSTIFYNLGKTIGGYYAEFHRRGHLRGYLNAWFGNEVVNPDGSLSLVDLDFSIMNPSFSKGDTQDLQRLEYSQARGAFSGEFESMFLHCFALVGYYMGKGFDDGYYNSSTPIPIPRTIVDKAISNSDLYTSQIFGEAHNGCD